MEKAKYMWAWKDDDDVYVNKADSIEEIVAEIIQYYDDDNEEVIVAQQDEKFIARFVVDCWAYQHWDWDEMECVEIEDIDGQEERYQVHCEFEASPWSASQFLDALARVYKRQDKFDITENN